MDCLSSVCLLQRSTIPDIFHLFLSLRKSRILALIDIGKDDIFSLMEQLPSLFFSTLDIASKLFLGKENCKFYEFVKIVDQQGLGQTSLLFSENTNFNLLVEYLPSALKRCTSDKINLSVNLRHDNVLEFCKIWCESLVEPMHQRIILVFGGLRDAGAFTKAIQAGLNALEYIHKEEDKDVAPFSDQLVGLIFSDMKTSWNYFFGPSATQTFDGIVADQFSGLFEKSNTEIVRNLKDIKQLYSIV